MSGCPHTRAKWAHSTDICAQCASGPKEPDHVTEQYIKALEAEVERLRHHDVGVVLVEDHWARLMVNGYGVASWPANAEVYGTGAKGRVYATECARVLRQALETRIRGERSTESPPEGENP